MRPTTTSTMLQQNNNNNYPCLNMSGSTREMLQKCSRASLPFPSRLELGDLPLIRGLRAWALCSKNRRKAGGLLGGGQAPTAPPSAGRGGSISCPRPADVYLSGEWGRMGYGLPLGLDAGQAGIGALVTVATLKTSEGSGKTQTQCLFLRTEKGSCLYSTAKPGSGVTTSAASSGVGGWLRGKTGGGGGGSRDHGPTPPAQTGANRVRVRSGRRWRKSCNAAGREKTERQQGRSGKDPAGEITLDERPEERDKGSLVDSKRFPSPQQDIRRKEGAVRSPRCCHNASPKTCAQCGRRAPRRASQDEHEGGESPRRGDQNAEVKGMRKERQRNAEEEEEEEGVLAVPNPDLESNRFHPETQSSCDAEEIREAETNTELKTETSHSEDDEDTNSEVMKIHTNNDSHSEDFTSRHSGDFDNRKHGENPGEEIVNGFSDDVEEHQESEKNTESVDVKEDDQTPAEFLALSTCPAVSPEASSPIEGSTCEADHETCGVLREHLDGYQQGVADSLIMGKEELDGLLEQQEANCAVDENNTVNEDRKPLFLSKNVERDASSSPLRHRDPSIFESDGRIEIENNSSSSGAERRDDLVWESREREAQEENTEQRLNLEEGEIQRKEEWTCHELDVGDGAKDDNKEHHTEGGSNDRTIQEDDNKEVTQDCAVKDNKRLQESADGCRRRKEEEIGDTCGQTSITHVDANGETGTNVTNVACADSSTSSALSPANPAPSLPPLGSMATGLPCLEAEKEEEEEEEEEGVVVAAGDGEGGQEGKRELEEQGEEERGSTVATEEGRKEEEEEVEEEDEFGVFMQAEGEPAWSEGSTMSASVPCGSRESVALGNHAITGESTHWTPGWTDGSFHQSDDTWTAFPQDSSDERRDVAGQWWPTSAVEESRDRLLTNQNLASVFAEAFPSLPASSSSDPSDLATVPTLTQLLRGKASQDQGLLDSFHDLNKMICQRYKRANGVSRDLLLKTLHLQQPHTESRPAPRTASRRLSPGLPSANQHVQNAAAKRRLSYDYNRNIME